MYCHVVDLLGHDEPWRVTSSKIERCALDRHASEQTHTLVSAETEEEDQGQCISLLDSAATACEAKSKPDAMLAALCLALALTALLTPAR